MSNVYWLMSSEALQRRLVREIREARTPLSARAAAPRAAATEPRSLAIANGIATITVEGVLTPTPDLMAEYYGEANTTYADLRAALSAAVADSGVREIMWNVDSPGGSVDGYFALLDDIAAARSLKSMRVEAVNAQSAAYGIAAAAGKITATSRTGSFGSVGVATSGFIQGGLCGEVVDLTNTDAPDKRPNLKTPEGKAVVVKYLDELAAEFHDAIAAGRGVTSDDVAQNFGRGGSMLAKAAKAAGLIDAIAERSAAANARTLTNARKSGSVPASMSEPTQPKPADMAPVEPEETPVPAAPVPADEAAPVDPEDAPAPNVPAALDALPLSAAERRELSEFRAERASRETAERRALVTELVALRAETPAKAWKNGAPVPRLASEPLNELRERVAALRALAPAASSSTATPPSCGEHMLTDFELRDADKIKDLDARKRFITSRIERKQKAQ